MALAQAVTLNISPSRKSYLNLDIIVYIGDKPFVIWKAIFVLREYYRFYILALEAAVSLASPI